jgi:hypothetical protein
VPALVARLAQHIKLGYGANMHLAIDAPALVITLNDQISRLTIYPRRSESHLETLIRLNAVGIAASELLIHNTDPTWIWLGDLDTAKTVAANVLEHLRELPELDALFSQCHDSSPATA